MKFKEYLSETSHPGFLTNHDDIKAWLDKMRIEGYEIASDGKVSSTLGVFLSGREIEFLPVMFDEVLWFACNNSKLKSLHGSPRIVSGDFACANNKLVTLEDGPSEVGGAFACNNNELTSLVGCPVRVNGRLDCSSNRLTSFEYFPEVIEGSIHMQRNDIKSLIGISDAIKQADGSLYIDTNRIVSGGLGLLFISGITKIALNPFAKAADSPIAFMIISKYIGHPDRIFECQEELINRGYMEFAEL